MKKLVFVFALVSVLAVSGCGKSGDVVSSSELPTSSSTEESVSSEESSVPEAEPSSDEPVDNIGGEDYCHSHKFVYHSFETELIQSVGWDEFNAWSDTCTAPCSSNIVEFVRYFNISKDELTAIQQQERAQLDDSFWEEVSSYYGMTQDEYMGSIMLSDEQIDAIYSGDEAKIETAFAGYLAADAEDGSRYSLTWLESHTPEEYVEAGIKPESVNEMLSMIDSDNEYKKYRADVQKISDTLEEAEVAVAEMK